MTQKIIYKNNEGGVSIITPSAEALARYTIQQVAAKDVPAGVAYQIVDESTISVDRTFRNAWEVAEEELTDGVGNTSNTWG